MQTHGSSQTAPAGADTGRNHPLARRMAIIAFLNQNITIACMYGTFSVLMSAVDTHLGVGPKQSAWGVPLVNLATAIVAPLSGALAIRYSLRWVMLIGSILGVLGFVVLATTRSYPLYLIAYGLGLGPAMASVGVVLPATLVTRWFVFNRGKALGLITIPLAIMCLPLTTTWLVQAHGLTTTYWALAALSMICVLANFFVVDGPPGYQAPASAGDASARASMTDGSLPPQSVTVGQLLSSPRFWAMSIASIAIITATIILTANMVLIAGSWGFSAAQGATLLSMQTLGGLAGTIVFGWVADRLGGVRAMGLLVFVAAFLVLLLLLHLPFIATAVVIVLFGLHSSGSLPVTGTALSELFGRESFSRAYGIFNLVNLPFSVACVPAAAAVYERTGSYSQALLAVAVLLGVSAPLAYAAHKRPAGA